MSNEPNDAQRYAHLIAWVPWMDTRLPVAAHHALPDGTTVDAHHGCMAHVTHKAGHNAVDALFVRVLAFPDGTEPAPPSSPDPEVQP